MTKAWFIAGTDTDTGKTVASCLLLQAAQAAGWRCAGYKPVAAGCELTSDGWRNSDAQALLANSNIPLDYQQVNPLALPDATSPHIASQRQGKTIDFTSLNQGFNALVCQSDWLIVEGAGGWYTPLNSTQTFADWVKQHRLPVILVVGMKLGCISHALLTTGAIVADGLVLAGWIANQIQPPGSDYADYLSSLVQYLPAPLLGEIVYSPGISPSNPKTLPAADCLSLSVLL